MNIAYQNYVKRFKRYNYGKTGRKMFSKEEFMKYKKGRKEQRRNKWKLRKNVITTDKEGRPVIKLPSLTPKNLAKLSPTDAEKLRDLLDKSYEEYLREVNKKK